MTLSVIPIKPPSCLAGQANGRLAADLLWATPGLNGGPTVRLVEPAARAWRALSGTAQTAGVILQATSLVDSYRPYEVQRSTFVARYAPEPTTYGCKRWDAAGDGFAELWCKKDPDYATAATPGTSNHGLGLAVDVANAAGARLDWLEAHAVAFGWSWELVPEEPWHIHYWAGDDIPAAVRAYEQGDQMAITPDDANLIANTIFNRDTVEGLETLEFWRMESRVYQAAQRIDTAVAALTQAIKELPAAVAAAVVEALPASGVGLTEQQVEDAAFRGAQRAERE